VPGNKVTWAQPTEKYLQSKSAGLIFLKLMRKTLIFVTERNNNNMKLNACLIFVMCLFTKCNSYSQTQTTVLNVPDSVAIKINNGQTQLYGTHIFLSVPQGFNFNFSTNRLEQNDSTYIKAVETPDASYSDKYNRFTEVIREESAKGFETYFQKEFILQNKKAIILHGLDKSKTTEQIILLFGDEVSSTMLLSRFAVNDELNKSKILRSLLSAYKSDSATLNVSDVQNFTIDMLDTKFKYNSTTLQMFFYTINGLGDPTSRIDDVIIIGQMQPMENDELVKEKAHSMIEIYRKVGININSFTEDSITIDNKTAFTITLRGKLKEQNVLIYGMAIGNTNSTILYQAIAYHNHETYLEQFKRIGKTLRLKQSGIR
jgi:hypothetical protein